MTCSARRCNDQFVCGRCGLQWDATDTEPPRCVSAGEIAIANMRRMIVESKLRDPAGWKGVKR